MTVEIGDRVKMRKPHPCGSSTWVLTRVGADIKMKCDGCGHIVMLDRQDFEKRVKKVISSSEDTSLGEKT
ncbi:MAG: DUF951 domain-containing protein [Clostridia bacterium]|nr:DUF951 domain-containing protein [Clostridia bacterium]